MERIRIHRPRVRRERPWHEVLPPDLRDPDVVRAKALARAGIAPATRPSDRRCSTRPPTRSCAALTIGSLVAGTVAAAGALLAVLFLPAQPAQLARPVSATAGEAGRVEGAREPAIQAALA